MFGDDYRANMERIGGVLGEHHNLYKMIMRQNDGTYLIQGVDGEYKAYVDSDGNIVYVLFTFPPLFAQWGKKSTLCP